MRVRTLPKIFLLAHVASYAILASAQTESVDIPNVEKFFVKQEQPSWCWAACNQMVLKALNISVTQEEQAKKRLKRFGGNLEDGAGTDYTQAKFCLNGKYKDEEDTEVKVVATVSKWTDHNPTDADVIISSLVDGIPIIMATPAHGFVCVGVDYVRTPFSVQITALRFVNPLHDEPQIRTIPTAQVLVEGIGMMTAKIKSD